VVLLAKIKLPALDEQDDYDKLEKFLLPLLLLARFCRGNSLINS